MLESVNPEIDGQELMAKVRAEVQRREAAGTLAPVPPAAPPLPSALEIQVAEAIREAWRKHKVDARFPEFIRWLFRNQGSINIKLIHVAERLAEQLVLLQAGQTRMEREIATLKGEMCLQRQEMCLQRQEMCLQRQEMCLQRQEQKRIASLNGEVSMQRQALTRLLDELKLQHAGTAGAAVGTVASEIQQHSLDAFYLEFENRFRGSREEIRKRLSVYLPYVAEAGVGTTARPILDLGCGRGEWLELLKENGYTARGVDMNISMLSACSELGLEVVKSDAIAHLQSLPDRSLGMVTGFHIIEHLSFPMLLELMSELYRVLRDGGLVVLETPNPGNIQVGACHFYTDPTHRRPLPSALTGFLIEYSGFMNVRTLFLQPGVAPFPVGPACSPEGQCLNEHFFAPQDYAVIGFKPATVAAGQGEEQTQSAARVVHTS